MALAKSDDWQSSKKSVLERNKQMFDNPFMSDITLTCTESNRVFHAHKYVLATSSRIFYESFLIDMNEKSSNLHLADTDEESLLEFLRFLYTDDINTVTWNIALKVGNSNTCFHFERVISFARILNCILTKVTFNN